MRGDCVSFGAIVVGAGSCSGLYSSGSERCGLCLAGGLCSMRAGWFAFLDGWSRLVSECRCGAWVRVRG